MTVTSAIAQNVVAGDVATSLDSLKAQAIAKIDQDLETNAHAFADAKNIQTSARWSDWFSPFLDISRAVHDGLTAIQIKSPTNVRSTIQAAVQGADSADKALSFATGFDRFWQDGQNLALAIDGPAYNTAVKAMLDRADDAAFPLFLLFDFESYRLSILNDLTGITGSSPIRVVRKSATVDRTGGQVLPTIYAAKNYILDELRNLSSEMQEKQMPATRVAEIVEFVEARKRDLLRSKVDNSSVSYSTYLLKGSAPVLCPVNYSLGSVSALNNWRITMLDAYTTNVDVELRVRLAETADTGLSLAADTLTEMVSFNLSYEATIAGQAQANAILKDATMLGFSVAKPDVGSLFTAARASASSAREQINMVPQQMMDALPGEVSKVLLLVDDTIRFVRTLADAPLLSAPADLTATAFSSSQINLAWTDNSPNEGGFKIERATAESGPWTVVTTTAADAVAFFDLARAPDTNYYYRVRAVNAVGGDSEWSNLAVAKTMVVSPPPGPLRSGTVVAWGANGYDSGQTAVPAGLTGVTAIAGGLYHSVALKEDGTVVAWGATLLNGSIDVNYGQAAVPSGLTGVVAIAAGMGHTVALKGDGTIAAWGSNYAGETVVPAGLSGVVAVAAGDAFTLALKNDGTVVGWGTNLHGDLSFPPGLSGVTAIAAFDHNAMALKADGTVVAWGWNLQGQATVPPSLHDVTAIAMGGAYAMALKRDGSLAIWGSDSVGIKTPPEGLSGVTAIAAGGGHAVAVKGNGSVVAWGYNGEGEATVPAGLSGAIAVASGWVHSLALVAEPGDDHSDRSTQATALTSGVATTGYVSSPTDVDWFKIEMTDPATLTFNLAVPTGRNFDLELYGGANPVFLKGSYGDTDTGESISYNVTTTGTYYVRVYGYPVGNGSFSTTAAYSLTVNVPPSVQFTQQGPKLVATDAGGQYPNQGQSVALSADGNTAIIGGTGDSNGVGAVWAWTRVGGNWTQQGPKLVGTGASGNAIQGYSVSLSADGNTAIVGGPRDNPSGAWGGDGAAWIWTRSGGAWSQQGQKLVGADAVGPAFQGISVSLSADGNTAIVGGYEDNGGIGAAWVWTRSGGVWTQQGPKLVGSGTEYSLLGISVSLSADGNTALIGGHGDNNATGAAWVWTRSGGVWTQQGPKLVGSGAIGTLTQQGFSVSLSGDGNTAIIGGPFDNDIGAAWVWTRGGGVWTQQGPKLVGSGAVGPPVSQGTSVSLSADGDTAIVGGTHDNGGVGAAWIWKRSGGVWTQQGSKLVGSDNVWGSQGTSVALSGNGDTAIVGGPNGTGAAWIFTASTLAGAPTIATQPTDQTMTVGANASFTVAASGTPTPTFQWQVSTDSGSSWTDLANNTLYSGVTAGTLTLTGATSSLNGYQYRCVATNSSGSTHSTAALLTVNVNSTLVATLAISSKSLTAGTAAVAFTPVVASGGTAPCGFAILPVLPTGLTLDASTGAITGTPAVSAVATIYTVTITDSVGATASRTFSLTVNGPLTTTLAIASTSLTAGTAIVSFAPVTVANGTAPFSFAVVPALPTGLALNANTGAITGTPAAASAATTYTVTATDSVGAISSKAFSLTVNASSIAPAFTAQPAIQTVNDGQTATFTVAVSGTPAPTLQWQVSTDGGSNWSNLADNTLYSGVTTGTLSIAEATVALDGYQYRCVATNSSGTANSTPAAVTVSVLPAAPAISVIPPLRQTVNLGQSLTLSVMATGTPAPTYQWKRNGLPISGATAATFAITSATMRDSGWYQVVATNGSGSATSAAMFVLAAPVTTQVVSWGGGYASPPSGLDGVVAVAAASQSGYALALKADGTVAEWGDMPGAPAALANVVAVAIGAGHSLALKSDGTVVAWGDNAQGQTSVPADLANVVGIAAGGRHSLALKSDGTVVTWGQYHAGSNNFVSIPVPAGLANVIAIAAGDHSLALKADGTVVEWGSEWARSTTVPANVTNVVAIAVGSYHSLAVRADGTVAVWGINGYGATDIPAGLANVVSVAAGQYFSLALKADGTIAAWGWNNNGQTAIPAGMANVVAVASGGVHSVALRDVAIITAPPTITSQPGDQTVTVGAIATFTVAANGSPMPSLQWQRSPVGATGFGNIFSGGDYSGTATATLTVSSTAAMSGDRFRCVASNGVLPDAISDAATLTVVVPASAPTIDVIADQTLNEDATTGVLPFTVDDEDTALAELIVTGTSSSTTLVPNGNIVFGGSGATRTVTVTPAANQNGAATITVIVSDGVLAASSSFDLVVNAVNDPPAIDDLADRSIEAGTNTGPLAFAVGDLETAAGSLIVAGSSSNTALVPDGSILFGGSGANRTVTITPVSGQAGATTIMITVNDGELWASDTFVLTISAEPVSATGVHAVVGGGYIPGGSVTVTNTITYTGTLSGLGWSVLPPAGWSYVSGGGSEGDVKPVVGDTSVFEWAWTSVPASPVTFTYTMNVPAGTTGVQTLAALALSRQSGTQFQALVQPDPLSIEQITHHSADMNHDFKLSLTELLRVIELYNTRYDTVRTGAYQVGAANQEDGFSTDSSRSNTAVVTLTHYHSADINHDAKLSLTELLRVIELYNHRSGTVRTGQYHVSLGTEDGFEVGP